MFLTVKIHLRVWSRIPF